MKVYRARPWRGVGSGTFDPLDSAGSVRGPKGWRFNDLSTEILYAAEVEALATLEVAVRPGWETIREVLIATIEIPDDSLVDLEDLGIVLPSNWNARPAADESRTIAREFLDATARFRPGGSRPVGVRVPSVVSGSNYNVLLDPARKSEYAASITGRLAFGYLLNAGS